MTGNDGQTRDRGVISQADRKYLRAPDEYSRQNAHVRKHEVADRIRNSVADFSMLLSSLPTDDRREIFERENVDDEEAQALENDIQDMIAFASLCCADLGLDFATVVENAIWRASEQTAGQLTAVDVNIEASQLDSHTDQLNERFQNADLDDELTTAELLLLMERDVISEKDALGYRAEMRAQRREDMEERGERVDAAIDQRDIIERKQRERARARRDLDDNDE